jgi:hypothetical protein
MNGAVFQTSAMMITISACGSDPSQTVVVPRSVFTKPYGDTNIVRHMIAVTTVSTPRDEHDGAQQALPAEGRVHGQRHAEADEQLQRHGRDGEDERVPKRGPPVRGLQRVE